MPPESTWPATPDADSSSDRAQRIAALAEHIRSIPDFPEPGILFRDITPLLADHQAFARALELMAEDIGDAGADGIVAIESRGFLFGTGLARLLGRPLLLARKPGKLPGEVHSVRYELEYGHNSLQMHRDAIRAGGAYVLVDDLLATGGTACAAAQLVEDAGGRVEACSFLIELQALAGSKTLAPRSVRSVLQYP